MKFAYIFTSIIYILGCAMAMHENDQNLFNTCMILLNINTAIAIAYIVLDD